jgi:hypothetical protein
VVPAANACFVAVPSVTMQPLQTAQAEL